MKKKILIVLACLLAMAGCLCGIFYPDAEINNTIGQVQNIVIDEIKAIDENVIVEDVTESEVSTTEDTQEEATIEDEQDLEVQEVEDEGFELQGEIAYEGDRSRSWGVELGERQGLTYYSQIDSRWKNNMYSSVGSISQTIGSSGCGPTSAAMVVSSIKGTITPDVMASLFVKYGYRSANNGTYWSAYRAVADEFNIGYTETSDIQRALDLLRNNNYVIVSCGNGLFTTGGHYIVLVGIDGDTLKIFDPYLYSGKFDTSTRRGKVEVSGNTIYCCVSNFKTYANYKQFFCYENNKIDTTVSKYSAGQKILVNKPITVAYMGGAMSIVDDGENQFWIHSSVVMDNRIYGLGTICYAQGTSYIVQIFDEQFWAKESEINVNITTNTTANKVSTVGQTKTLKTTTTIYSNSNLSGTKYTYKANTTVKILENVSSTVDKVQVVQTGRIGYMKNNYYK